MLIDIRRATELVDGEIAEHTWDGFMKTQSGRRAINPSLAPAAQAPVATANAIVGYRHIVETCLTWEMQGSTCRIYGYVSGSDELLTGCNVTNNGAHVLLFFAPVSRVKWPLMWDQVIRKTPLPAPMEPRFFATIDGTAVLAAIAVTPSSKGDGLMFELATMAKELDYRPDAPGAYQSQSWSADGVGNTRVLASRNPMSHSESGIPSSASSPSRCMPPKQLLS